MSHSLNQDALRIQQLGTPSFRSPISRRAPLWITQDKKVVVFGERSGEAAAVAELFFEEAGPRENLFFNPAEIACGIVTCGGLCPGLNNVIRALVLTLHYHYGVRKVFGYRYGFAGLTHNPPEPPLDLTPEAVADIHLQGGTILGSSRGPQDIAEMVQSLTSRGVRILFAIGGDGTLRGARALVEEIAKQKLQISVIAIPKTIDNDIQWIARSFGFSTAVEEARRAIMAAHVEAKNAWNGICITKLMGRHSGFISAHATLANADVNFCLIPEVPFRLQGSNGLLESVERRLQEKRHAVMVVAEGAGQDLMTENGQNERRDPSGNIRLKDIGLFLRDALNTHFKGRGMETTIKYIDPSYMIRSLPANSLDSELCLMLGQHAVHAGMSGRTDMMVGYWNQAFTHVPLPLAIQGRRMLEPESNDWQRVLEITGQNLTI